MGRLDCGRLAVVWLVEKGADLLICEGEWVLLMGAGVRNRYYGILSNVLRTHIQSNSLSRTVLLEEADNAPEHVWGGA